MLVVLFAPLAFGGDATDGMRNIHQVAGEKIDSGLGDLSPSFTGAEFMKTAPGAVSNETRIAGEKLDCGLASVTNEEVLRIVAAYQAVTRRADR